jgi:uncharacterized repeat protein (TIGR02543 family)
MSRRHRGLSALLATALAAGGIALVPAAPAAAATLVTDWASLQAAVNDATEDVAVELGASIDNPGGQSLSVPVGVTVTLDLTDRNLTINGLGNYVPAIRVPSGAGLVIDGTTGRLTANGGASAAAIGGKSGNNQNGESAGSITIRGGDVRATAAGAVPSRGAGGAGIGGGGGGNFTVSGGGNGGNGGTITITGGIVRATSTSTYTVRDGAGIGGGGGSLGTSGNGRAGSGAQVTITGGTVIAVGGENSSGIGSGGAYELGGAGSITVQGVAAAGSVTNGGRRSVSSSYTRPATITATGTPTDQVFRAVRAGNNYSVRIEYPAAVVFDSNGGTGLTPLALEVGSTIPEPNPAPTRVGHTFVGWYADAALTTAWNFADDVTDSELTTLYASWTVNSYPVTFVSNGGSAVLPQPVDYGTTVTAPTAPIREGYSFVGWFADAALTTAWDFATDVMPASGITLYAKWSINSYDVTFVSNGGSAVPTQSVVYDTHVTEPSDPTREGYTFAGWFADAGLTSAWDFAGGVMPSHAIPLYADWSINSYIVTFDAHGGSAVPGQTLDYASLVAEPSDPSRVGHTFAGWFGDAAFTTAWDFDTDTVPASELTLHAKWTVNDYGMTFVSNGGSAVSSQLVDYGTVASEPMAPTREGYTFAGWFTEAALTNAWDFDTATMPAHAVTLYAQWSINSYLVSFDENGGALVPNQTLEYQSLVTEPADPTREGHTFAGWFADGAFTTPWDFSVDAVPAHPITLHAKWTVNSYTVSFDANGGSAVSGQTLDYGTLVAEPAEPTRVGHTFAGWFADAGFAASWDFGVDVVPASDVTLYAKWTVNSYLVSFASNGGSAVPPQSVDYDELVAEPTEPTREGHTFAGWFADAAFATAWDFAADTVPASDITLYAKWSINSYLVSFATNGGSAVPPQPEVYNTLVTEPAAPTRDGHTFVGWFADAALTTAWDFAADRVPASAITLYAQWSINSYTVSFDSAGGTSVPDQTIEYGSPIVPPSPPTRTDFVFAGWYDGASEWTAGRSVLGDVALTAHWTAMVVDVVAGSQQALIRWHAMALPSGAATSYTVAVEPGGLSCTTTTTACAVTGLAAGSYSAVVTAHWAGASAVSDAVTFDIVDLAMPSEAPTESTPAIALALLSGGSPITTAIPGARITVQGSGFVPGSSVELFAYSVPEALGTTIADADGEISVGVVVPAGLELGAHTIVARGFSADALDGGYGVAALAVVAPALSSTGVEGELLVPLFAALMLLVLGAAGIVYARRRMGTEAEEATTEIGG